MDGQGRKTGSLAATGGLRKRDNRWADSALKPGVAEDMLACFAKATALYEVLDTNANTFRRLLDGELVRYRYVTAIAENFLQFLESYKRDASAGRGLKPVKRQIEACTERYLPTAGRASAEDLIRKDHSEQGDAEEAGDVMDSVVTELGLRKGG